MAGVYLSVPWPLGPGVPTYIAQQKLAWQKQATYLWGPLGARFTGNFWCKYVGK